VQPNSGLIHFACAQPLMPSYFIPELAPAPKWCSFLDGLTEELEEQKQNIYADYKFVTREELNRLGLTKLIGTDYLRAYMHGFFMDIRLFNKMKAITDPFEYEKYRKEKIKEKIDKEASTRISVKKKLPSVNAQLLSDPSAVKWMNDTRFKDMFQNPDFQVDEDDPRKTRATKQKLDKQKIQEHFDKVDSSEDSEGSSDDEVLLNPSKKRQKLKSEKEAKFVEEDQSEESNKLDFYEIKEGHEDAVDQTEEKAKERKLSFGKRLESKDNRETSSIKRNAIGQMEMTFIPEKSKKQMETKKPHGIDEWVSRLPDRRSVKELNLKKN